MLVLRNAIHTYGRALNTRTLIFSILLGGLKVVMHYYQRLQKGSATLLDILVPQ